MISAIRTLVFTRSDFDMLRKPCVYVVQAPTKCAYIGSSRHGLNRVFNKSKGQINRQQAFEETTYVNVWFFEKYQEALEAEAEFIHAVHPTHNKTCVKCNFYSTVPRFTGAIKRPQLKVKQRIPAPLKTKEQISSERLELEQFWYKAGQEARKQGLSRKFSKHRLVNMKPREWSQSIWNKGWRDPYGTL